MLITFKSFLKKACAQMLKGLQHVAKEMRRGESHGHFQYLEACDVVCKGRRDETEASISRWLYSHTPPFTCKSVTPSLWFLLSRKHRVAEFRSSVKSREYTQLTNCTKGTSHNSRGAPKPVSHAGGDEKAARDLPAGYSYSQLLPPAPAAQPLRAGHL